MREDHRADALRGDDFQQHGVRYPTVDDMGGGHSPRTARRQPSILGTMPASSDGSRDSSASAEILDSNEPRSGQLA